MTAAELLRASAAVYAGCRTYRDRGRVVTRFRDARGRRSFATERPFATAFVRPDRFRFEFRGRSHPSRSPWTRYLVHADAGRVRTWWGVRPGVEEPETLSLGLAGATGVSGGSAHTVPALLLPDQIEVNTLARLTDLGRVPGGRVGSGCCHRLVGRPPPTVWTDEDRDWFRANSWPTPPPSEDGPVTVWLDAGTLLVRRIEESSRSARGSNTTVTDYAPRIDRPVAEADLRFDPPAG